MKKIINETVYDTETSELIYDNSPDAPRGNFEFYNEKMYRTQEGEYFMYRESGTLEKGDDPEIIIPLDEDEAFATIDRWEDEGIPELDSNNHAKDVVELTPEWILDKVPHTMYADGDGVISLYCDANWESGLVELALDKLSVNYSQYEYVGDGDEIIIAFDFHLKEMLDCTSSLYDEMYDLNLSNINNQKGTQINNNLINGGK